jgi:Flp pilus assembly protein TadG
MRPAAVLRRRQCGAALAEAAITLPLLFGLVFGTIDIGHAASIHQALDAAARQGAYYASLPAEGTTTLPSSSDVASDVSTILANLGVTDTSAYTVTVNQDVQSTIAGISTSFSQVEISYQYPFFSSALSSLSPTVTLSAQALMRNETN